MSAQHLPYITLDSVVNDYLLESEQSVSKYYKIWQLAFRGLEDMGLDFFYQVRALKLPVLPNRTVKIPPDFLQWTKVGILNDRGEIIPLYYNDKFTTYADLSPDRLEKTRDDSTIGLGNDWGPNTWANFWNGYAYINIYGVPSGSPFVGSFKIDLTNGVILLNERFDKDYIMMEYVASPKEGQEYYLPIQFREAMIGWLAWKDSKAKTIKSHMQLGNMRELERQYYNERRKAIARWKPIRIYDMYQVSQEMTRMAIKS
jgi:hypothetical protein